MTTMSRNCLHSPAGLAAGGRTQWVLGVQKLLSPLHTFQIVPTVFLIQVRQHCEILHCFCSKIVEIILVFVTPMFNGSAHCAELKLSFKCLFDRMNE